jgi:hypothetical protein
MRGDGTEYAVKWMNSQFKEKYGEGQESGVVYDVNFYGQDFVPPKFVGLKESHQLDKEEKGGNYFDKDEEWRSHVIKDSEIIEHHENDQELSSLLMMRTNMQSKDWAKYRKMAPKDKQGLLNQVDAKYQEREANITAKKEEQGAKGTVIKAGTGIGSKEEKIDTELSSMSAENAIYEEMLENQVTPARIHFQFLKNLLKADPSNKTLQKETDEAYAHLKQVKSEAMTYANAAYYTAGAVISVVTNKQQLGRMYKNKGEKKNYKNFKLTPAEYYHAFTEQIGFAMHGLHKADGDEDTFYAEMPLMGKYVHRAYNNIKHLSIITGEELPYTKPVKDASSDWEGVKQGKGKANDGTGYSHELSSDATRIKLEEVVAIFIGQANFTKIDGKLDIKLTIQQIGEALIRLKAQIDSFYSNIKKKQKPAAKKEEE